MVETLAFFENFGNEEMEKCEAHGKNFLIPSFQGGSR
jgi:hypothetical protein